MKNDTYSTRHTLIQRLKTLNDDQSWSEFVYYYRHFIFSVIHKMGIPQAECEDLSQKVLLKIWNGIQNFDYKDQPGSFRKWIYTVTKHTALSYIAKSHSRAEKFNQFENDHTEDISEPEIDKIITQEWEKHISFVAFENIKKKFSEKVIACFEAGLRNETVADTAKRLDLSESSVYMYKTRVKERLISEIRNLRELLE